MNFSDVVRGLIAGDFSRLALLFEAPADGKVCPIIRWYDEGLFAHEPKALAEAFSCACFNGRAEAAEYLMNHGVDPTAGDRTGMDAFHWAVNRGQLETVRLLLRRNAPLEGRNAHGTTVLGTAVWSAINEPKPDHLQIIEELLSAGARPEDAGYPTGHERVDAVLRRHGAS